MLAANRSSAPFEEFETKVTPSFNPSRISAGLFLRGPACVFRSALGVRQLHSESAQLDRLLFRDAAGMVTLDPSAQGHDAEGKVVRQLAEESRLLIPECIFLARIDRQCSERPPADMSGSAMDDR